MKLQVQGGKGRKVSIAMSLQQSPKWPIIQIEVLPRISPIYAILRESLCIPGSQLFWKVLANYLSPHLGQATGNNLMPNTFLSVYFYCENGKNQVNSSINYILSKKAHLLYFLTLLQQNVNSSSTADALFIFYPKY